MDPVGSREAEPLLTAVSRAASSPAGLPSSSEGRPRGFWSRFGFGSVPGDPEEARAFLQRRVGFYLGFMSLIWVLVMVSAAASARLFMPELLEAPGATTTGLVHLGGTLALILCWVYCRRGRRSLRTLDLLDAGTTIGQALLTCTMMGGVDMRFRPDLNMTLGLACTLLGRAAVVPGTGTRTLVIGLVAAVPVAATTYLAHLGQGPTGLLHPGVAVSQIGMWLGFAVLVSTIISRTIYGLSVRVQEAARLGQYTLERRIGQGGMGTVYLARHALLRRPTAIKLLAGRASSQDLERFEREVQTTSALRHPNTVAVYDYGRTPEGVFYYAMEYLDGVDLERLVQLEGPLPEGRVVHILLQVAGALEEAHAAGLIHRDVKPSNVFLCNPGHQPDFAKVLDFGLVKQLAGGEAGASTMAGTLTGTPLYMSPEAIISPSTIDARSDLYAVGALAYTLLAGEPPFTGRTALEVCGHHLHTVPAPPSQRRAEAFPTPGRPGVTAEPITPALEEVVLACLHKERARRPASAAILADLLARCPVRPWSVDDARAWWASRGEAIRAQGRPARPSTTGATTVAVDLLGRGEPSLPGPRVGAPLR